MTNQEFIKNCKKAVVDYFNSRVETTDRKQITEEDVYIVWLCKTLQNHKALVSTNVSDGMYYELTYNGDKEEMYLDAYKKWENKCISFKTAKEELPDVVTLKFPLAASANEIDKKIQSYIQKGYVIETVQQDAIGSVMFYRLKRRK